MNSINNVSILPNNKNTSNLMENYTEIKNNENTVHVKEDYNDTDILQRYNKTTNYYIEYWKYWMDNEVLVAKIKEKSYEIELMLKHIERNKTK